MADENNYDGSIAINTGIDFSGFEDDIDKLEQAVLAAATKLAENFDTGLQNIRKTTETLSDNIDDASESVENFADMLKRGMSATTGFGDIIEDEIIEPISYIPEAVKKTEEPLKKIGDPLKEVPPLVNDTQDSFKSLANTLVALGIAKIMGEIVSRIKDTADASIEFESAITGVYKTVDGSEEQLKALSNDIKELSTDIPITTTELSKIAESAGQLKVQTDNIIEFTDTIAKISVATDLTSESAATMFAQFANITKMDQKYFSNLGSTITALGNNSATTESKIADMAQNIAAAGKQVNMSQADIVGLAAALSSLGLESQKGGSSFSKLMIEMQLAVETGSEKLKDFAAVAGTSATSFAEKFRTDATGAIIDFVTGLSDTTELGQSTIAILDEMGLSEVRLRDTLLRTANANELFVDSITRANQAWEENTALTREAELRFGTTESKMQLLKNSTELLKIAIGDQLNPTINGLIDSGDDIVKGLTEWVQANEWVVPSLTALTVGLGVFVGGVTVATVATKAFTVAIATNPAGAVTIGVLALATAFVTLGTAITQPSEEIQILVDETEQLNEKIDKTIDKVKESRDAFNNTNQAIETESEETVNLTKRLEELMTVEKLSNIEKVELKNIVEQLNTALPTLGISFDEVSGKVQGYTRNIYDLIEAKRQMMKMDNMETQYISSLDNIDRINEDLEKTRKKIDETQTAIDNIKGKDTSNEVGGLMKWYREVGELNDALTELKQTEVDLQKERIQEYRTRDEAVKYIDEHTNSIDNNTNANKEAAAAVGDYTKSVADATGVKREYAEHLKSEDNIVKALQSDYKLLGTQYEGNENSLEALTAKTTALNKIRDAQVNKLGTVSSAYEEEAKRNADLTAQKERLSKALEDNIDRIETYNKSTTVSATAHNQLRTQNEYYVKQLQEIDAELEESTGLLNDYKVGMNDAQGAVIETGREIQTMSGYLNEAANSSDGFATTIDGNGKLVKDISASTTAAIAKDAKAAEKATKDAAKESEKAIEETVKPIDEAFKSIEKSAESLIKSYESTRDAAKNSFQSQLDYFRESAEGTELTAKNILDSMTTFTGEAIGYNEDLQRATELGFTDGFVATLTDGGKESKQVLKTILDEYDKLTDGLSADDTKAFVDDFNWAFGQTHKATDALAETVAEMKTGFSDKAQEMLQIASDFGDNLSQYTGEAFDELKNRVDKVMTDLSVLIKPKGEKTVEELKSGIEEKTPDAIEVSETLAAGIIEPIEALEKKAYTSGGNFVKGYMSGVQAEIVKAKASGTDVAEASLEGLREGLDEHSPSRETYKSGVNTVLGYVGGVDDNLWRVDDVMGRMARSVVSSLTSTNEIVATSQQALVDYYNAATRFEKIDLSQFQNVFKDFSAFQDITETSMQTLDSLVNNIGLDLSSATSEVQQFKDSVYGLDREIITIWDAYGNVFQAGNMPGYMPDPNNPGMAIVNDEYWKEADRIDRLWYNNLDIEEIEKAAEETNIIIRDAMINAVDMGEWGAYVAQMFTEGYIVAMYDEMGNVIDATEYFTNGIKKTVEDGLEIHSPSGFTMWIGDMMGDGLINSIKASTPHVVAAVDMLTLNMTRALSAMENTKTAMTEAKFGSYKLSAGVTGLTNTSSIINNNTNNINVTSNYNTPVSQARDRYRDNKYTLRRLVRGG